MKNNPFSQFVLGISLSLPAHGRAEARATPFHAAFFAKRKTKFGGGKARAGKNSFPPTPLLFCPPERIFSEISVGIFAEKSSDFVQEGQQVRIFGEIYSKNPYLLTVWDAVGTYIRQVQFSE